MKTAKLLVLLLFPVAVFSQRGLGLSWSTAMPVANGTVYDNVKPQVSVVRGNEPLVLWGRSIGGHHGYVAYRNGLGFSAPFKINPSGGINAYTVEGPNLVARGDTAYLVYVTYPSSSAQVMLRSSFDAGQHWSPPVWVDSLGADMPTFGEVAILPGGHPIVTYIRQTSTYANPRWVVRKSTDFGNSWLPEVNASDAAPGNLVCDCCEGHVYPHAGKVIEVFRNNNSNLRDFHATVSLDGALTFPVAIDLDSTDWTINACPSSGSSSHLVGDSIYTAFMSQGSDGRARVYLGASSLATGQMAYNRALNGAIPPTAIQNYTTVAGRGDTIFVAWMESANANPEIMLRYSFTGIQGLWTNPIVNVTEGAAGQQSFPSIDFENGMLHVVWADDATNQVMYRSAQVAMPLVISDGTVAHWEAYPNPAHGFLDLKSLPGGTLELSLSNAVGEVISILELDGTEQLRLDLTQIPSGLYFLRLTADGVHQGTKKLLLTN